MINPIDIEYTNQYGNPYHFSIKDKYTLCQSF
jgi:hypothetical protein